MGRHITIIQGHPDPGGGHFCHALADAYAAGAAGAGHTVERIEIAALEFPLLRDKHAFEHGETPPSLLPAQVAIERCAHLLFVYPLWLGTMPALMKGFLEQVFRPGFAFSYGKGSGNWRRRMTGRSARVVVTMGMPALVYRWYYLAHGVRAFERGVLAFTGIGPVRENLVGMVESGDGAARTRWLRKMQQLGATGT